MKNYAAGTGRLAAALVAGMIGGALVGGSAVGLAIAPASTSTSTTDTAQNKAIAALKSSVSKLKTANAELEDEQEDLAERVDMSAPECVVAFGGFASGGNCFDNKAAAATFERNQERYQCAYYFGGYFYTDAGRGCFSTYDGDNAYSVDWKALVTSNKAEYAKRKAACATENGTWHRAQCSKTRVAS